MKKILTSFVSALVLLALVISLVACGVVVINPSNDSAEDKDVDAPADAVSGGDGSYSEGYGYGTGEAGISRSDYYYKTDGAPSAISDGEYYEGREEIEYEYPVDKNNDISAGLMTAKAWNDNEYYEQWKELFAQGTDNDPAGKFYGFTGESRWAFDTSKRVKVTVTKGGEPAIGVNVKYIYPNQVEWVSKTDVNGVAYVFPSEDSGKVAVDGQEFEFSIENRELAVELEKADAKANVIKIMFVIDATGSMGDEMRYVAAELTDVVSRVAEQAKQVKIELALLFYRDHGDQEIFAYHDFEVVTESKGLENQLAVLQKQCATGGGDTPEAVDEAMVKAVDKNWGNENSTNLIFLVLDAPSHDTDENVTRCAAAVKGAAAKGIRICPVLCSGADTLCEYTTRMGALLTGGTSVFVTDDSGIGGTHLDPELPDAVVEKLNDLMVRLIVGYHTGDFGTPVPYEPNNNAVEQK